MARPLICTGQNEETMKTHATFLRTLWLAMVLLCSTYGQAQQAASGPERLTLQVEGLTSETRDALSRELDRSGEARIAFACVPAGIMVIEARQGQSRAQLETRSRSLLTQRSAALRSRTIEGSLAQAEAACAQARNR
ncbi:MAG: hypothetical protein JNN32_07990 [Flavobacteriales bacterium]|nr:hypothetical protein [Flavobacteriales bacterium]